MRKRHTGDPPEGAPMRVGIPREIKTAEGRIAIVPAGVFEMVTAGHEVVIEASAGRESGYSDDAYRNAGARIFNSPDEVFADADMIMKVKEPLPSEYELMRPGQIVFTYFHFAADERLTLAMIDRKVVAIAYETVQTDDRELPLLLPMSEVAGRMAVQEGAKYLERPMGGRGVLLPGVPGVSPAHVLVLGGGVVGQNAALIAAGIGADVIIADINLRQLRRLDEIMPRNVKTVM